MIFFMMHRLIFLIHNDMSLDRYKDKNITNILKSFKPIEITGMLMFL